MLWVFVCLFVFHHHHCYCLGLPSPAWTVTLTSLVAPLPWHVVLNTAATSAQLKLKSDHATSLFRTLPRLPFSPRTKVKVLIMAHEAFGGLVSLSYHSATGNWPLTVFPNIPGALLPQAFCTCWSEISMVCFLPIFTQDTTVCHHGWT